VPFDAKNLNRMTLRIWRWTWVAIAMITIACDAPANLVRVAPTPRVDSLTFELSAIGGAGSGPGTLVYGVSVVDCEEHVFWTIASDGTRALPQRFAYGSVIPGFETRAGPMTLVPGCYKILVSRAKPLRFEIGGDGSVTPRP
jgi:hypothetical protein